MNATAPLPSAGLAQVPHVIKGQLVTGATTVFGSPGAQFTTPALDLKILVKTFLLVAFDRKAY